MWSGVLACGHSKETRYLVLNSRNDGDWLETSFTEVMGVYLLTEQGWTSSLSKSDFHTQLSHCASIEHYAPATHAYW